MTPTVAVSLDMGPMWANLPKGCVDVTRAVHADEVQQVRVSRFDDPAESPEAYSLQRHARAAEVSGGGAEILLKESRKVDGRMGYLTVYRTKEQGKAEDRAFLVFQIRKARLAMVELSGRAAGALRDPILETIRVTSSPSESVSAPLSRPVHFGEFTMSLPVGVTRRTAFSAEDRALGISWRMDADVLAKPALPNLSIRLPRPPELERSRDPGTVYRRADRVGSVFVLRTSDPELGTPGPVTVFAAVVVDQRILVHVLGRAAAEVQERLLMDMTTILDGMTLAKGEGQ